MKEKPLFPYLPSLVFTKLTGEGPFINRFPSAVLFTDIVGFSRITEQLEKKGPTGAETIASHLNVSFSRLFDIVIPSGGDIIKFAGDAFWALWYDDDIEQCIRSAVCCADQIHKDFHAKDQFQLKIGIAAGNISLLRVGGMFGRWELIIAGKPLQELGRLDKVARPKDIIIGSSAMSYLKNELTGELIENGAFRLESHTIALKTNTYEDIRKNKDLKIFKGYIPGAVLARPDAFSAELRYVSVLFLSVRGIDYDAEDSLTRTQEMMQTLQKILYRFEGSVNRLNVDEKGTVFLSALGLPPLSHEDDPVRCVESALQIYDALHTLGLGISIGVTTGRIFCGTVGSELRQEYTMHGDSVNFAARLMQNAGDGILCDLKTFEETNHHIIYEELPSREFKGKQGAFRIFKPLRIKDHPVERPLYRIGRFEEKEVIRKFLESNLEKVLIIEGEAGMGKTALIADALGELRNCFILRTRAEAIEKKNPYFIFGQIIKSYFRDSSRETIHRKLFYYFQDDIHLIARLPLLNNILGTAFPVEEVEPTDIDIESLLLKLIDVITSKHDTVFFVDNAQWIDRSSLALIQRMKKQVSYMKFIFSTRPFEAILPESIAILEDENTSRLKLESLSKEKTRKLILNYLAANSIDETLLGTIYTRTEGHPLFTEEVVKSMLDKGFIVKEHGHLQYSGEDKKQMGPGLPDTLQNLLLSRIDSLSPMEQNVLKVAAVVGREFNLHLLEVVFPVTGGVTEIINSLEDKDFIQLLHPGESPVYTFKNAVLQEMAANLMLYSHRAFLHKSVAEWYEKRDADHLLLAHHWRRAGENKKAARYLELAGREALHNHAYQEALTFFLESEKLPISDERKTEKARRDRFIAKTYFHLNQFVQAKAYVKKALHTISGKYFLLTIFLQSIGEWKEAARSMRLLSKIYKKEGNHFAAFCAGILALYHHDS